MKTNNTGFHEFVDDDEKGIALIFDSPKAMIETAAKVRSDDKNEFWSNPGFSYRGRKAKGWDEIKAIMATPWPEAARMIQHVINQIDKSQLPTPKSIKRKRNWSEDSGEIVIDRALGGDPLMFQDVKRQAANSPTTISILANLETITKTSQIGVYWRSAAAIAVVDILEELGYSCELWIWCAGTRVYEGKHPNQFVASMIKEAGTPLNIHNICDVMSEWFTVFGVFGSFPASTQAVYKGIGGGRIRIGEWMKHLQTSGAMTVQIPITFSADKTIEGVKTVLDQVLNWKPGNEENL